MYHRVKRFAESWKKVLNVKWKIWQAAVTRGTFIIPSFPLTWQQGSIMAFETNLKIYMYTSVMKLRVLRRNQEKVFKQSVSLNARLQEISFVSYVSFSNRYNHCVSKHTWHAHRNPPMVTFEYFSRHNIASLEQRTHKDVSYSSGCSAKRFENIYYRISYVSVGKSAPTFATCLHSAPQSPPKSKYPGTKR